MKTIISQAVLALHVALCRLQRRQAIKIVLAVLTVHNLHHSHIQQHVIAHPVQPVQQVRINVQAKQVATQPMEHVHYRRVMRIIINLEIPVRRVVMCHLQTTGMTIAPALFYMRRRHLNILHGHVIVSAVMRVQHLHLRAKVHKVAATNLMVLAKLGLVMMDIINIQVLMQRRVTQIHLLLNLILMVALAVLAII